MEAAEARDRAVAQDGARPCWRVRLLGAVEADLTAGTGAPRHIAHWPTRAVAALLARLALAPHRTHAREQLVELLWPGVAPDVGRNRLRQTLSTLKTLLEPAGCSPVLVADRLVVRVAPGGLACDAVEFEQHVRAGRAGAARSVYLGELMPGYYDDWIAAERDRLAALHEPLADEPARAADAGTAATARTATPARGLPSYLTRPFGLAGPAERLQALARLERLVTVHGPGGSGKTRLATEAARALSDAADAPFALVAFVPLLACTTADQTMEAVATAIGAIGAGAADARVRAHLAARTALLVIDNAEQLEPAADDALSALLQALPRLHLVVTSRRLLGIDGEHAFEAQGLPLPDRDATDRTADSPAVALFVDRARSVNSVYTADARTLQAVAGIVRLLAGMPLAIELAASRLRSRTAAELFDQLSRDGTPTLDLLARGAARASADARHASMRHVVAWSWALLQPTQRELMQALSIFGAPAQPAAITAVAGQPQAEVLRQLDALHDLALVRNTAGAQGPTRWVLLQPVREFAAEQQSAAQAREARARLRGWLTRHAAEREADGPAAIAPELVHVHAVIASASADDAARESLELAVALRTRWDTDGLPLHTLQALEDALGAADLPPSLRSRSHELLAFGRCIAGDSAAALRHAQAAVDTATDPRERALGLARWAWAAYFDGRFDADYETAFADAERCAEACGDPGALALVLRVRALIVCNLWLDFEQAEELAVRAQALHERAGQRAMAHYALLNRYTMWAWRGRDEDALIAFAELLKTLEEGGDWAGLMHCTRQQGRVLIRVRRFAEAVQALGRSLRIARQQHMMQGLAQALLHVPEALLHGSDAEAEAAARLQGYAVMHWDRLYPRLNRIEVRELTRARRMLRRRLGPARAEALMLAGRTLALPEALALAPGAGESP